MRASGDRPAVQDDRLAGGSRHPDDRAIDAPDVLPITDVKREIYGSDPGRAFRRLLGRKSIRPLLRLAAITAWTAGGLVILLAGLWVTSRWPMRRLAWRNLIVKRWARVVCRIAGIRLEVVGAAPQPPFFLVSNHLSYVDILVLLAETDGVFVAKRELNQWPVVGYLTRLVGTIFVDRASRRDAMRVLEDMDRRIAGGDGVTVFPEGTSSDGAGVYPMKPALFEWAARNRFPVHCVTLGYETPPGSPPAGRAVLWWGAMSFVPHVIDLCGLPGFRARLTFAEPPLIDTDRARLAARARDLIASRFVPHGA